MESTYFIKVTWEAVVPVRCKQEEIASVISANRKEIFSEAELCDPVEITKEEYVDIMGYDPDLFVYTNKQIPEIRLYESLKEDAKIYFFDEIRSRYQE